MLTIIRTISNFESQTKNFEILFLLFLSCHLLFAIERHRSPTLCWREKMCARWTTCCPLCSVVLWACLLSRVGPHPPHRKGRNNKRFKKERNYFLKTLISIDPIWIWDTELTVRVDFMNWFTPCAKLFALYAQLLRSFLLGQKFGARCKRSV